MLYNNHPSSASESTNIASGLKCLSMELGPTILWTIFVHRIIYIEIEIYMD